MRTYFHGTSLEAAHDIVLNGFSGDKSHALWTCSSDDTIYLYSVEEYLKHNFTENEEDYEPGDIHTALEDAKRYAVEAASITNSVLPEPKDKMSVLEIQIEDGYEDFFLPDRSCENMEGMGAVQANVDELNELLRNHANIILHKYDYNIYLAPFYLTSVVENDYFIKGMEQMNQKLLDAALIINRSDSRYDIYECLIDYDNCETITLFKRF